MTEDEPDEMRTPEEVARRALALNAVVALGFGVDRGKVLQWLTDNDLWHDLSPRENGFVDTVVPSKQQLIDAAWQCECLFVLLWALGLIAEMPPADVQCDTGGIQGVIPPFADIGVGDFIRSARLRDEADLLESVVINMTHIRHVEDSLRILHD